MPLTVRCHCGIDIDAVTEADRKAGPTHPAQCLICGRGLPERQLDIHGEASPERLAVIKARLLWRHGMYRVNAGHPFWVRGGMVVR